MEPTRIASREDWLAARKALLAEEKALTRARDEISRKRRTLPWVRIDTPYVFDGPQGRETLAELFAGRSQLIVYHFMLAPGWEHGCPSCSFLADTIDGTLVHLAARDVTFAAVSRAPLAEIRRFQQRMGWRFTWVSSHGSDFNYDFGVSFTPQQTAGGSTPYNYGELPFPVEELPGTSVFARDDAGAVYHTYSSYGRGGDLQLTAYTYLDLVPKGRDEDGLAFTMSWVRHHDRYETGPALDPAATYQPPKQAESCCGPAEAKVDAQTFA
ncbi:DUF899 domain-containing protein [Inquilinus sp. CA228]|uniref:DUF899 domain-containing protein n=1 Tax=Inquilinus sp. CA228 TaxID=3455609 RepID=UPI003F8D5004